MSMNFYIEILSLARARGTLRYREGKIKEEIHGHNDVCYCNTRLCEMANLFAFFVPFNITFLCRKLGAVI